MAKGSNNFGPNNIPTRGGVQASKLVPGETGNFAPGAGPGIMNSTAGPSPMATQGGAQALTPEEQARLMAARSEMYLANQGSGPGSAAMLRQAAQGMNDVSDLAKREWSAMSEKDQIARLREQLARAMSGGGGGYSVRGERGGNTFGGGSPSSGAGMGGLSSGGLY